MTFKISENNYISVQIRILCLIMMLVKVCYSEVEKTTFVQLFCYFISVNQIQIFQLTAQIYKHIIYSCFNTLHDTICIYSIIYE
jgi:hypothetical protein